MSYLVAFAAGLLITLQGLLLMHQLRESRREQQETLDRIRSTGRTVEISHVGNRLEFRCGASRLIADINEHGLECVDWVLDDQHPGNFRSMAACCTAYAEVMEGEI